MELDGKQFCDECKKEILEEEQDCLWIAKDGREYCTYCYSEVFYPKYYGFTRNDWKDGKAGYVMDKKGNPIKLHEDSNEITFENNFLKIQDWWNWDKVIFKVQQFTKNKNPEEDE